MAFIKDVYNRIPRTNILALLLIINFLGSIWGFLWYRDQLSSTPIKYWIFTPDSPTATLFFSMYILLKLLEKENTLLGLIACVWLIKYGIWAVVINLNLLFIDSFTFENLHLTLSHMGMAFEGLLFLLFLDFSVLKGIIVIFLMIISDYADYGLKLHPCLFLKSQYSLALRTAVALTFALSLAVIVKRKTH